MGLKGVGLVTGTPRRLPVGHVDRVEHPGRRATGALQDGEGERELDDLTELDPGERPPGGRRVHGAEEVAVVGGYLEAGPQLEERGDGPQLAAVAELDHVGSVRPDAPVAEHLQGHRRFDHVAGGTVDGRILGPGVALQRGRAASEPTDGERRKEQDPLNSRHASASVAPVALVASAGRHFSRGEDATQQADHASGIEERTATSAERAAALSFLICTAVWLWCIPDCGASPTWPKRPSYTTKTTRRSSMRSHPCLA